MNCGMDTTALQWTVEWIQLPYSELWNGYNCLTVNCGMDTTALQWTVEWVQLPYSELWNGYNCITVNCGMDTTVLMVCLCLRFAYVLTVKRYPGCCHVNRNLHGRLLKRISYCWVDQNQVKVTHLLLLLYQTASIRVYLSLI